MTVSISITAILFWIADLIVSMAIVNAILRDSDGETPAIVIVALIYLAVFMATFAKIWGFL